MKRWKFLLSSNGWEYGSPVIITAKEVKSYFTSASEKYWKERDADRDLAGDTINADGVVILFDEPLEFIGWHESREE